ncbi:hypothetical protein BGX27_006821 [Mortierella sp. AM989]|nr:hypothetical protein BGX27_006821 [Mortierella sp. AM989]
MERKQRSKSIHKTLRILVMTIIHNFTLQSLSVYLRLNHLPGNQESWGSTIRMESPAPLSDSESSHSDTKETQNSDEPRQLSGKNILRRFQRLPDTTNTGQKGTIDATSQRRGSLESEHATRFSYESQREVIIKPSKSSNNLQDISDEERQETKRSKPTWRPSLPLIRQEGSSFNVLSMQDQRRYPQNDQHRISDTPAFNEPRRRKSNRQGKKKRKASSRKRKDQQLQYDSYSKGSKELPTLAEVLEKKSRFPLSYDDFEAFLKSQRAVEYLNFWADVTAHEQLCRTFNVSERRLKREYQLEERALARDRRRLTRPEYEMGNTSSAQDGSAQEQGAHNSRIRTGEQEMNNSNLYLTSRSSLQLPLHDHLSFPPEPRRYGIQDSVSQRRGSEQRATGAYNRLLAGAGARRSSLDASRQSLDEIPLDNDTTFMDAAPDGLRFQGRRPSIAVDYYGNGIKPSASQLSLPPQKHDQNMQGEIAQLAEAVEELIPPGRVGQYVDSSQARMSQQSLKIVEPIIHRKQSMVGTIGPLQSLSPLTPRRSGESAHAPSLYSTVHDGRPILAQSYRTISLEDLEESALRIYRKYLIQLRTSSMAREEEAAAANSAPNTTAIPTPVIDSAGRERILAPGWEGYAEQVIAEWNQRWKGRSAEARRARRLSNRRDTLGHGSHALDKKVAPGKDSSQSTANAATTDANNAGVGVNEKAELSEDEDEDLTVGENSVPGRGSKGRSTATHRPKLDRDTTATGITSFIARLLRTETTVLELPTLTVNTTTVVTDADSDGSEYDDDDFDSDDMEYEEDEGADVNNDRLEAPKMTFIQYTERPSIDNTVEGSTAGDPPLSETGSAIQLQQLVSRQPASEYSRPDGQIHRSQLQEKPRNTDPTLTLHSRSGTAPALLSSIPSPEAVAQSAAVAAFYLPLECRERIHTQIQQEKRIDGAHVFGPAKGFVVDVVLRDFYFPLFLNQVKKQNMGLLHRTHVNNRIKQRGMMVIGIALWMAVIALQVMLVMMAWGGWTSPWVWVVGIVGGWPGAICLATGMTGFSPILGLVHKM